MNEAKLKKRRQLHSNIWKKCNSTDCDYEYKELLKIAENDYFNDIHK